MPTARPPAAVAPATMKLRRVSCCLVMIASPLRLHRVGGAMYRAAQARISAATANIGDIGVDIRVRRIGEVLQERDRRHDLAGLAVTALRHVLGDPGLL